MIYLKDLKGRYLLVNQQFLRIFNLMPEQVIGLDDFAIFSAESARAFQSNDQAVIKAGKPVESEEIAEHTDGVHTYISVKFPIFDENNNVVASGGISTDISDRKKAEQQLIEFNQQLEQRVSERTHRLEESNQALQKTLQHLKSAQDQLIESEKMASLGSLVAGVAHEINTPVGIGVTAASAMQQETADIFWKMQRGELTREQLERYLDIAQESNGLVLNNLERAAELFRTFKLVAVDQSTEDIRSFVLREYIQDVLVSLKPAIQKAQVRIELQCPDGLMMHSYPGALSQVLTNLIINAIHHAFSSVQPSDREEDIISILVSPDEQDRIHMTFSDNGRGVEEDMLGRIFEPFVTSARGDGGSGLGAHITYNLVTRKLKGHIHAHSTPGEGLTITMQWPADVDKAQSLNEVELYDSDSELPDDWDPSL